MRLNEVSYSGGLPVEAYGPGYFQVGGENHDAPMALFPEGVVPWGGLTDAGPFLERASDIDVVLFGMGAEIAHLPRALSAALDEAGIGAEVMSSPQACRTYNVLLGEGRRVALAALSA